MPGRGKRVDYEKFCQMVKDGKPAEAITKALGISSTATLKNLHRKMMLETGRVWTIPGMGERITRAVKFRPSMGLVISRATLAANGFNPGDTFSVTFEGKSIVLKKD